MELKLGRQLTNDKIAHAVHYSRDRKLKDISTTEVRARHLAELSSDELATLAGLRESANGEGAGCRSSDEL